MIVELSSLSIRTLSCWLSNIIDFHFTDYITMPDSTIISKDFPAIRGDFNIYFYMRSLFVFNKLGKQRFVTFLFSSMFTTYTLYFYKDWTISYSFFLLLLRNPCTSDFSYSTHLFNNTISNIIYTFDSLWTFILLRCLASDCLD